MIKHGRKEYILGANTLIFNRIRYQQNLFKNCNNKCFFCGNIIAEGKFVAQMKCRKHIYHYGCLMKWVRENMLDNTNFFCPICQNKQLHEISSRTDVSRDDNDNLLNNTNSNNIMNIDNNNDTKTNNELLSDKTKKERISNLTSIKGNSETNNINNEIVDSSISLEDKKERNIDINLENNGIIMKEDDTNINNENNINNDK